MPYQPAKYRAGLQRNEEFASWLAQLVVGALYPGSPFSRRFMALVTMRLMLQVGLSGADSAFEHASALFCSRHGSTKTCRQDTRHALATDLSTGCAHRYGRHTATTVERSRPRAEHS